MIIKTQSSIPSSEITDQKLFVERRQFLKTLAASGLLVTNPVTVLAADRLTSNQLTKSLTKADVTAEKIFTSYNNYYEYSFNKEDPSKLATKLDTKAWTLEVSGEVEKPLKLNLEALLKQQFLQEYIYRFRCVEAWSMVVPWIGFSLASLLKAAKPLSTAHYVQFSSMLNPAQMPNQANSKILNWPYYEGLRIDEAMHPLTILASGAYGETLQNQNGAPLRLVVPWKYGFKSIKAIVKIELLRKPPITSWNQYASSEYGFYANVNPDVPHPRWSQASERLLGSDFFTPRRETELFNGYQEQVGSLYSDLDLRRYF